MAEAGDVEVIRAMFDRLKADAGVSGLLGDRIWTRPPGRQGAPSAQYPYLSLGPSTVVPEHIDCIEGADVTIQLDIWSTGSENAYASAQCRTICAAVSRALHKAELVLADNALIALRCDLWRILDDPNPAIAHGAMQFTATIDTPS